MSAAGRCAAQDKKAASPLISGRLPRSRPGDAPREGTGPPLQRQACGDGPAGPGSSAGASTAPQAGNRGRRQPAPPRARRVR